MNIVIVGHVDHGKSTLIGRLLYDTGSVPEEKIREIEETCRMLGHRLEFAYIADALEEERRREMTIETTQTFFKGKTRDYTIIDAPGHKEFIKNMATGASQAEAAVLIVDVTRGMEEQSRRHAYILKLLGVDQVIVAVNKMDLVGYDERLFLRVAGESERYLSAIGVKPIHIVPVSAYMGDNVVERSGRMPWYNGVTVLEGLDSLTERKLKTADFRFPVQDVYRFNGEEVYVGNILSGAAVKGMKVEVYPKGGEAVITKIVTFEGELEKASRPKAVGLAIKGVKPERGSVLASGSRPLILRKAEPTVFCLMGSIVEGEDYIYISVTQEVACRVEKVEAKIDIDTLRSIVGTDRIKSAEIGRIKLYFSKPIVAEKVYRLAELGRFVLQKEGKIVGGGIIT